MIKEQNIFGVAQGHISESNIFEIAIVDIINPFVPNAPFLYPLKISENHKMG